MLTRLKITGFKNLLDVDISFGPFSCIAGTNGVGKSNLFDAILFLRDLTEFSLTEAAARVRDPVGRSGDLRAIFHQSPTGVMKDIELQCEFIVSKEVKDDFGRLAKPSNTFLQYELVLRHVAKSPSGPERIEIIKEDLTYIKKDDAKRTLGFPHSPRFRNSVIEGRRMAKYISTQEESGQMVIQLHQDGRSGRQFKVPAANSPKTILGGINTDSYPTVLAARREMQAWTLLQLEPTALRQPDNFSAETNMSASGAHMPATLLRLNSGVRVSNQLAKLIEDIREVGVDQDEGRRLNTLVVTSKNGITHPARSLSDGTLRFLALAILQSDPDSGRLLCLEEPENGIHPSRIPAILDLLKSIAVDPEHEVDQDNPLRQVIINTHSPSVVEALDHDGLIMVRTLKNQEVQYAQFCCMADTWRSAPENGRGMEIITPADLQPFLTKTTVESMLRKKNAPSPERPPKARSVGDVAVQGDLFLSLLEANE